MHIFLKFIFPFNSLLCSNICIVCEESNSVNVIKFVSFVTPSKMKFKNIYKMSKSDRGSPSTNMEAGKWKQSQGLLRPLNRIHHQIRQLRLWFSVSLKIFLKKRQTFTFIAVLPLSREELWSPHETGLAVHVLPVPGGRFTMGNLQLFMWRSLGRDNSNIWTL